jgi:hypothetical protein
MGNLILTTIRGYRFEHLKLFMTSLEKTGFDGHVCMYYDSIDASTLEQLRARQVELIPFSKFQMRMPWNGKVYTGDGRLAILTDVYPLLVDRLPFLKQATRDKLKLEFAKKFFSVFFSRFLMYREYLQQHPQYDKVLICDVRDLYFQKDPFDFPWDGSLSVFNEDSSVSLDTCANNRDWIENGFGAGVYQQFRKERVSCAGVTMGALQPMLEYLDAMNDAFFNENIKHVTHLNCYDQGTHNYILWKGILKGVRRYDNLAGPVLTMGTMPEADIQINEAGLLVNADNSVINIIHQYDRHPGIKRLVEERYGIVA